MDLVGAQKIRDFAKVMSLYRWRVGDGVGPCLKPSLVIAAEYSSGTSLISKASSTIIRLCKYLVPPLHCSFSQLTRVIR